MSEKNKVLEYAKKMGYEGAYFRMEWKGYSVYEPVYSDELSYIGLPLMILEKDGKIRMTDVDEAFEILDLTSEEDEKISEYVDESEEGGSLDNKKKHITTDSFFNKIKYFFRRGNKNVVVREKDTPADISYRRNYVKSYGVSDEKADILSKYAVLDNDGNPFVLYRGIKVSPDKDNGGKSAICPNSRVFCLSNKFEKSSEHGDVHRYFLISKKPYFVKNIKETIKDFESGEWDVAVDKSKDGEYEFTVKDKDNLVLID